MLGYQSGHGALDGEQRTVDVVRGDAVVGDGADAPIIAPGEEDPGGSGSGHKRGDVAGLSVAVEEAEEEDVGLDGLGLDDDAGDIGQPLGEPSRSSVIF